MNNNLENKKLIVDEIKSKLEKAKTVVFVDYAGLNVAEADKLRRDFKTKNAEYKVYKNRLLLRALTELNISGVDAHLNGSTSVAFGYEDAVSAPKIIADTIKETKKMSIKFGLMDGDVITSEVVKTLAGLPTKEVLVSQLLSVFNGPVSALARALNAIAEKNA